MKKIFFLLLTLATLSSCGFHLQGAPPLVPSLHSIYIKSPNPYGLLVRNLKNYLKMSHVVITDTPQAADVVLQILQENESQQLLSVSSSQQTRQYSLILSVTFSITHALGHTILEPRGLRETRTLTIQSNDILAGSNQASLFYEDMEKSIAYAMMNILASQDISAKLATGLQKTQAKKS